MSMDSSIRIRNWADMPIELLGLILDNIVLLPDFIRFGAVCKQWYSAAKQGRSRRRNPNHQEPPMLWSPCYIYSIGENKTYPNYVQKPFGMTYRGTGHGWLTFVEANLSITVLNPFLSSTSIPLPTNMKIPDNFETCGNPPMFSLQNVILSCDPHLYSDDWVFFANVHVFGNDRPLLFFIRSGEDSWKHLQLQLDYIFYDACFCQGKLYIVNLGSDHLLTIDLSQHHKDQEEGWSSTGISNNYDLPPVTKIMINNSPPHHEHNLHQLQSYLVELERDLLLVRNFCLRDDKSKLTVVLKVWKLHSNSGNTNAEWIEITDLGKFSLFLGDNCESVAICSDIPNFQPNCIYYMDSYDYVNLCIYNLATRLITRRSILDPSMKHRAYPPVWISPKLERTHDQETMVNLRSMKDRGSQEQVSLPLLVGTQHRSSDTHLNIRLTSQQQQITSLQQQITLVQQQLAVQQQKIIELQHQQPQSKPSSYFLELKEAHAPTFAGSTDPLEAVKWITEMEKFFQALCIPKDEWVNVTIPFLIADAEAWFISVRHAYEFGGRSIDWAQFRYVFFLNYFPATFRIEKENEFVNLQQGSLTVIQYASMFNQREQSKVIRFKEGLNLNLREYMETPHATTYQGVLEQALRAERLIMEKNQNRDSKRSRPCKKATQEDLAGSTVQGQDVEDIQPTTQTRDPLILRDGPMTRSRKKKLKDSYKS